MNQITFDNAETNRAKLQAVETLLLNQTIQDNGDQNYVVNVQGASDFLRTLANSDDFATLSDMEYSDLITPLNAKLKTLVADIKAILTANVTAINNEFAQL